MVNTTEEKKKLSLFNLIFTFFFAISGSCGSKEVEISSEKKYDIKKAFHEIKANSSNIEHLKQLFKIQESESDRVGYYLGRHLGDIYKGTIDPAVNLEVDYSYLEKVLKENSYLKNFVDIEKMFPEDLSKYYGSHNSNGGNNAFNRETKSLNKYLRDTLKPLCEAHYSIRRNATDEIAKQNDSEEVKKKSFWPKRLGELHENYRGGILIENLDEIIPAIKKNNDELETNYAVVDNSENNNEEDKYLTYDKTKIEQARGELHVSFDEGDCGDSSMAKLILTLKRLGIEPNGIEIYGNILIFREIQGRINNSCKYKPSIKYALERSLFPTDSSIPTVSNAIRTAGSIPNNVKHKIRGFISKFESKFLDYVKDLEIDATYEDLMQDIICNKDFDSLGKIIEELEKIEEESDEEEDDDDDN